MNISLKVKKDLSEANLDILRLEVLKTALHRLSVCQEGPDKTKERLHKTKERQTQGHDNNENNDKCENRR